MKDVLIKNYRIIEPIGEGGMATVYLAEDIHRGSKNAIKFLSKDLIYNIELRKRFIAEAKNLHRMHHPNIIKVFEWFEEGDIVAFVMEYIEGQSLKEYIDTKGKLSDGVIKNFLGQMIEAVAYVHECGLVHRDIKPSNFMVTGNGTIKLLDFGIAKNTNPNSPEYTITQKKQTMGTPMYMSPEQVKDSKFVTFQTDIYSLGVVLWQMVTGRKPYNNDTISNFEMQSKIVNEKLPYTGSSFDLIIEHATAKAVENRYKKCSDILNDLKNPYTPKNDNKTEINNQHSNDNLWDIKLEKTVVEEHPKIEKKQNADSKTSKIDSKKGENVNSGLYGCLVGIVLLVVILLIIRSFTLNNFVGGLIVFAILSSIFNFIKGLFK